MEFRAVIRSWAKSGRTASKCKKRHLFSLSQTEREKGHHAKMNRHCTNLCSFLSNLASSDRTFKALSHIATPFFSLSRLRSPNRGDSFLFESSSSSSRLQACTFLPPPPSLGARGGGGQSQCLHSEREREKRKKKRRRPSLFPKPPERRREFLPPFT